MTMNPFKHKMCELSVSVCANCVLLPCYFGWILLWGRNCAVDKAFRNDLYGRAQKCKRCFG